MTCKLCDDTAIIGKLNIKISHGEGCGSWAYAAQGVGLASTATDTLEDCQASRADYAGLIGNDGVSDCVCFEKTKGTVELTYKPTFVVLAFNNHIIHEPVNLDSEQINVSLSMKK